MSRTEQEKSCTVWATYKTRITLCKRAIKSKFVSCYIYKAIIEVCRLWLNILLKLLRRKSYENVDQLHDLCKK